MSNQINKQPIGVFDSGLGGLTVVKQLMKQLPQEDIVYFGDTARVPYGTKSKQSIIRFSLENAKVLLQHKVKLIVVACNSSSAYALSTLTKQIKVPVIGVIQPGAYKAATMTNNKRIGIIATRATVQSLAYTKSIRRIDRHIKCYEKACPLFVPLIEEGWARKNVTRTIAADYLKGLLEKEIDTLILGCTHYPLLKNVLKQIAKDIALIDSAEAIVKEVKNVLNEKGWSNALSKKGKHIFLVSDRPQDFKRIAKGFLGKEMSHIKEVNHV